MITIIHWNPSPELFTLGSFPIRYYGVLFVTGLYLSLFVLQRVYKTEKLPEKNLEKLMIYTLIGIIAGARLGHCLFYEPGYYLTHPVEMLLPVKSLEGGGYKFIGYQGLASHGGAIGLVIALWLFSRKTRTNLLGNLDHLALVAPLTGAFIRLGNLMNSEIIGNPTDVSWAFVFVRVDPLPRHPSQLYEALAYLLIFGIMLLYYKREHLRKMPGALFGLSITLIFSARFIIEFTKRNQEEFEEGMLLNMGQLLSIPFIIIGIYLLYRNYRKSATGK